VRRVITEEPAERLVQLAEAVQAVQEEMVVMAEMAR
jgi:hypothetical protein